MAGWVTIEIRGKPWREWIVASPNKVVNLHLLLRLLDEVKGNNAAIITPAAARDGHR